MQSSRRTSRRRNRASSRPADVTGLIALLHTAFPQLTVAVEDSAAEGDTVWARPRGQETHRGELMGLPPTGKAVAVDIIDIRRVGAARS